MAVLQGFTYSGSLRKFNRDQGCWPLYPRWPLLRGDRYEGFHCTNTADNVHCHKHIIIINMCVIVLLSFC